MATTTNYGWTTPDDTALVKDGAAAIRTLGSSVDSTLKTQVDNTVASSIQKSVITTTGDVIYASGANTPARLGIGTSGQVLQVSGGLPAWGTAPSGGMTLISTTTLSGSSVNLTSIPTGYSDLRIYVRNFRPNGLNARISIQFNGDTAARYRSVDTNSNEALTFSSTSGEFGCRAINGVSNGLTVATISDYTNTATWKMLSFQSVSNNGTTITNMNNLMGQVYYNQTAAISSIQLFPNFDTFVSGTVLLYGVK